ncbi:alpha/beta hydrolase fold domain-containing protein [Aurantiacibacter poecillastricola]|uniref:alpha/beta hydrolase fold domain-containing protein n=1 Tax=Aurantiacibacter poecillastricola TaxID=3064385 RepID=UPI00273DB996|nr:alpha/beta hydrolase fold domain-containing protein [Aurantiacibacter sp. 219JJ12-13]MDP5263665.1 alpha/beta hydrolase fold domain-containing protein [Aurantiacibacter sp. 219JJ12-13]
MKESRTPRAAKSLFPRLGMIAGTSLMALVLPATALAQAEEKPDANPVQIDADGTVHVPAMSVPVSSFLTDEAKKYLTQHLHNMQDREFGTLPENGVPFFMKPYMVSAKAMFPLVREEVTIAGVAGISYTPTQGIKPENRNRILLNLHGGGFGGCYPGCAELESMPIASLGGYKVITIDYRQAPEHRFPAASEDVASVYRELLKTYKPADIGIYGCSAGGMLVGMAMAWFDKEGLPMPGAAGIFCAGMTLEKKFPGFGGDAHYMTAAVGEANPPVEPPPPLGKGLPPLQYLENVDVKDPLAAPANSPELLAKFPPTLFITGTRAFELSSAVYSHGQMVKAGAEADLHVWDGLFHGFFYNPAVPESQDAYKVIVDFFDKKLGK